jgi:2-polyprenyl-3-methyl-5-hydroxy-6-metoxy-1,4-benzoquinol methylase
MSVHSRHQKFVSDQRDFFDSLITEDWHLYFSLDWDTSRRYEVTRLFGLIKPQSVLDIGCGCGFHDKEMAEFSFVEEIHAIDYSAKSIEAANQEYPHPKVRRSTTDLRDLSKGSYDLVVSWQVFEHLDDPNAYFQSALRVTRTNGWIAIFTPNRLRLSNVKRILERQPIQYCDPQHFYEYTPRELKKTGKRFGLECIHWFGYGLSGVKFVDKLPIEKRLVLGSRLPWMADNFCMIFKK